MVQLGATETSAAIGRLAFRRQVNSVLQLVLPILLQRLSLAVATESKLCNRLVQYGLHRDSLDKRKVVFVNVIAYK